MLNCIYLHHLQRFGAIIALTEDMVLSCPPHHVTIIQHMLYEKAHKYIEIDKHK